MYNDIPDRLDCIDGVITDEQAEKIKYLIVGCRFKQFVIDEIIKQELNYDFLIDDIIFLQLLAVSENAQNACVDYKKYCAELAYRILVSNREYKREMLDFAKSDVLKYLHVPELYGLIDKKISYDISKDGKIEVGYNLPDSVSLKKYLEKCKEMYSSELEGVAHINHATICLPILAVSMCLPNNACKFILLLYAMFELLVLSSAYERSKYSNRTFVLRLAKKLGHTKMNLLMIGIGILIFVLLCVFNQ